MILLMHRAALAVSWDFLIKNAIYLLIIRQIFCTFAADYIHEKMLSRKIGLILSVIITLFIFRKLRLLQFQQAKPPVFVNDSIGFVQRFHWFRSTISMDSFSDFNGFVAPFCRFCCSYPMFPPFVAGNPGLTGCRFMAWGTPITLLIMCIQPWKKASLS